MNAAASKSGSLPNPSASAASISSTRAVSPAMAACSRSGDGLSKVLLRNVSARTNRMSTAASSSASVSASGRPAASTACTAATSRRMSPIATTPFRNGMLLTTFSSARI